MVQIDRYQASPGRAEIGLEEQHGTIIADQRILMVEIVDQLDRRGIARGQILHDHAIALVRSAAHGDDQVAAVFRDVALVLPVGLPRPPVDQRVGRLRIAEPVVVELVVEVQGLELGARPRLFVATVVEALAVFGPGGIGELGPFQLVGQQPSGLDVQNVPGGPVGAGLAAAVGEPPAVVAETQSTQGNGAVLRPPVRIQQHPGLAAERVGHVEHRLVLQTVVLDIEVSVPFLHGRTVLGEVPQIGQPAANLLPLGDRGKIGRRDLVLGRDPVGHRLRRADVVFQPTVRIRDLRAVINVDVIDTPRVGILDALLTGPCRHVGQQSDERQACTKQTSHGEFLRKWWKKHLVAAICR